MPDMFLCVLRFNVYSSNTLKKYIAAVVATLRNPTKTRERESVCAREIIKLK